MRKWGWGHRGGDVGSSSWDEEEDHELDEGVDDKPDKDVELIEKGRISR